MPHKRRVNSSARPMQQKQTFLHRHGATLLWLGALLLIVFALVLVLFRYHNLKSEPATETEQITLQTWRGESAIDLYATVTLPAASLRSDTMGLVVLCHGFTGNRQGDGHFAPLAEQLAQNGIASIALDFSGNGESVEPFTAYTLDNMMQDVRVAITYMQDHYGANGKIGLLGHSMGGRLVSLMLDDSIAAAALWSPANGEGLASIEFISHDEAEREALLHQAQQNGSVDLPSWGVTISYDFLDQMQRKDPLESLSTYQGSLLIAFAAGDPELLSQQTIDDTLQAAAARGKDFVNLYGQFADATHNYTALSGDADEDAQIRSRIETATANFFIEALAAQ